MLGNVPDFVILALALSKIEAVLVPLDSDHREPGAGDGARGRAAARAHHPGHAAAKGDRRRRGSPTTRAPSFRGPLPDRRRSSSPNSRRRLQGTLLTCGLYKRTTLTNLTTGPGRAGGRAAHRQRRRRPQGRHQDVGQSRSRGGRHPQDARRHRQRLHPLLAAAARQLRLRLRPPDLPPNGATLFLEDEVAPKRIAKLLREQRIDLFAGDAGAVRIPWCASRR